MDIQSMINIAAGIVVAVIGWYCKAIWDAVASLRIDLHKLEIDLPTNYIRRDEFQDGIREIKEILSKISDKLDGKADKP